MQIRLGYELIYDCPQPTPMLLMLNVHYTRVSDLVEPDHLVTAPAVPIRGYRDGFGNWCSRIIAPAGQTRLTANAIINDTGEPDVIAVDAPQHTLPDLPDDALVFLLGSRYCETDRLPMSPGRCSARPRSAGAGSRRSATLFTSTSSLATSTRVPAEPPGKPIATAPASAAILPTSRSLSAAA